MTADEFIKSRLVNRGPGLYTYHEVCLLIREADKSAREDCANAFALPAGFLESIATTETVRSADCAARRDCARIVATLAERPYDSKLEFSALMVAELEILRSIK